MPPAPNGETVSAGAEYSRAVRTAKDSPPFFVDVARDSGLTAVLYCGGPRKDHILESVGSGVAVVDYDEDGRWDIYLVNAWALDEEPSRVRLRGKNVLYRNIGNGQFEDVTDKAGVGDDSWGCGVCAGDYDNDGRVDLFVTNFGPDKLYRNLGQGKFEEVGQAAGVADNGWGSGAAFFDADGDGDLDLYLANYIDCEWKDVLAAQRTYTWRNAIKVMTGPFGLRGGRDRFFRNVGEGRFVDATDEAGMTDIAESYGMGVIASDLDNDGDVDVYVANDSNPNYLYRNEGGGRFSEVGTWTGSAVNALGAAQGSMGVDAGDVDGDGLQELFVTNFALDYSTLYLNAGRLFFEDVTARQQLDRVTFQNVGWGCAFCDYDLDGDLDLVQVNGHIYPQVDEAPELGESYRQPLQLLRNDGGRFVDVSAQAFARSESMVSGRGLAVADFDGDGDLDFVVTVVDAPPLLLRNDARRHGNWLKLRVVNRHGSPAIGARATIFSGASAQIRELRSGSTYQSQNALELHFGVPKATHVRLEIRWPDGELSRFSDLPVNTTFEIRQGRAPQGAAIVPWNAEPISR